MEDSETIIAHDEPCDDFDGSDEDEHLDGPGDAAQDDTDADEFEASIAAVSSSAVKEVQTQLARLGFPVGPADGIYGTATRRDVSRFQLGYNLGDPLTVDGVIGPKTRAALHHAVNNAGGRCSAHFAYREFASNGNRGIQISRRQLQALEKLRAALGRPISTTSDYRDPAYNRKIKAVPNSMHLFGVANDLPRSLNLTIDRAVAVKAFSGIGWKWSSGRKIVTHVDTRGPGQVYVNESGRVLSVPVTTSGTPQNPTIWDYN